MKPTRQLVDLLNGSKACILTGPTRRAVRRLTADSRQVMPETLFVALRGVHTDGHRFLGEALDRGASVLVVEEFPGALQERVQQAGCTVVKVPNSRQAFALLASAYYGHPGRRLRLIGITGTNGKTTTSYIIESILQAAGKAVGVIGTVSYRHRDARKSRPPTPRLMPLNCTVCWRRWSRPTLAMPSWRSQAMRSTRSACGAAALKRQYLPTSVVTTTIITARWRPTLPPKRVCSRTCMLCGTFSISMIPMASNSSTCRGRVSSPMRWKAKRRVSLRQCEHGLDGIRFTLSTTKGQLEIASPLVGRHNVYNLLAGIAVAIALDIDAGAIIQGIAQLQRVPGRLERVDSGQDFAVFVDYAHTPDALEQVLQLVRAETTGRLITVFGCGGDRDPGKRPLMGQVATRLSDYTIITSDNPRTEDPQRIIDAIITGVESAADYVALPDRQEAIEHAIAMAQPRDTIVIAGKGHEDYQILGQTRRHFDDREVAQAALERRR